MLWDEVVVGLKIIVQGLFKFGDGVEAGLSAKFTDAAVETFDHAICLRLARSMATKRIAPHPFALREACPRNTRIFARVFGVVRARL
jgi:hypothetical protein